MVLFEILAGVVAVAILLHIYLSRTIFNFWEKQGVPCLKATPFIGLPFYKFFLNTSPYEMQMDLYNKFKNSKLFGYYEGWRPALVIKDPELIKRITVKDFNNFVDRRVMILDVPVFKDILLLLRGQRWKDVRSVVSPMFSSGKMKRIFETVVFKTSGCSQYLEKYATTGEQIELKDFFSRYTVDVIASTVFGLTCNTFEDENHPFQTYGKNLIISGKKNILKYILYIVFPKIAKLFGVTLGFLSTDVTNLFSGVIDESISYREKENIRMNDFLQLLIDAKIGEDNGIDENKDKTIKKRKEILTDSMLKAQALTFFFGGFDSTATAITYLMYELTIHEEIQDKVREEVRRITEKNEGKVTYDTVTEMEYLDMALQESLRLHTPAPVIERVCTSDYHIPEYGITLKKEQLCYVFCAGLHNDPQYYPEPEKFIPERFSKEAKANRHSYVHLPFGVGPRNCIGMRFAIMEAKAVIASLLLKYKFVPGSKTDIPMQYKPSMISLNAKNGVWCKVERID